MFVHLRLHTEYSVTDGTNRIDSVVAAAAADCQPALAITDLSNLFGALKFYRASRAAGLKPLIGAEVIIEGDASDPTAVSRILLLVQCHRGYLNLSELLARAWTRQTGKCPAVCKHEWLMELNDGLIALSGAAAGPVGHAIHKGDIQAAAAAARCLAGVFDNRFYLELQRAGRVDDEMHVRATVQLACELKLPVVATHPVQFPKRDDFYAHEARVCIAEGRVLSDQSRPRIFTEDQYFKSTAEMESLFADIPSALTNAVEIAKRCSITFDLDKPQLPNFPTPNGMPIAEYFSHLSHRGLEERLQRLYPVESVRVQQRARYVERLEFEIKVILNMGFPGYFLIVGDFIGWAKKNGCPVGPGRGSGAGSLVAYALKITDLDPLEYNLLFERFLNPDRVSMPDFDIDFCQTNRDRVIDYVKEKYGRDAVSQIVTFGTMASRAAIRDVGRVLDMSYGFVDSISKLIPAKPGVVVTLQYPPAKKQEGDKNNYAIEMEPVLAGRIEKEEEVRTLVELAQKLEGLTRNVGMHAGGVLIAPGKLTDFCPLYQQPGSESAVSQYDKDDVEAIGLVKFDFLGLATLTILEIAKDLIVSRHEGQKAFAYEDLRVDDAATYRLFAEGKTEAVFQFESRGMQGMLRDARPARLEDLIALNALYRPGPMDLIPSFVARKNGLEEVLVPHPLVKDILAETYGIMVYQEQVMQTAQILGGYSLGAADLLRRAMGKKKPEEMAKHRLIFREGAAKNGLDTDKADEVFDLMEKFAGYGFNKSHAAAYSLLAYQTGWLKVHYAAEFFCANMTVEMDNTDKLKVLHEDATKQFGIDLKGPDINRSMYRFMPLTNSEIRYGLGAIKGTGHAAIDSIVREREIAGDFVSFFDFCRRIDRRAVNKRTVETLIRAGSFDCIEPNRASLAASVELGLSFGATAAENQNQGGLFDTSGDGYGSSTEEPSLTAAVAWSARERLNQEKAALGFYLSGHLFDAASHELRQFVHSTVGSLVETRDSVVLAGVVSDLRSINGARGKVWLFRLDDKTGIVDVSADETVVASLRSELADDNVIVVHARVLRDRMTGGPRLGAQSLMDLPTARCAFGKYLLVPITGVLPEVRKLVKQHPALRSKDHMGEPAIGLPVRLAIEKTLKTGDLRVDAQLDNRCLVYPSDEALVAWSDDSTGATATVIYN